MEDIAHQTLIHKMLEHVELNGQRKAFTFLNPDFTEAGSLTFGQLDSRAKALAVKLQSLALRGERALLLVPPGLGFVEAFLGCLYAGVIAVPAYPPQGLKGVSWHRIDRILNDAACKLVLCLSPIKQSIEDWLLKNSLGSNFQCFAIDSTESSFSGKWNIPDYLPDEIAFLQYTSGSTGTPKGVMVSHGNISHNQSRIQQYFGHTDASICAGWMPPYHDMGLIGHILQPLYVGMHSILMAPMTFLRRPLGWLEVISRYGVTTSGGPNFAYDLCVDRVRSEDKRSLRLDTWEVAYNGAEPVRARTLQRFIETFSDCNFNPKAFFPCYGLAESTLIASGSRKLSGAFSIDAKSDPLRDGEIVIGDDLSTSEESVVLVSSGNVADVIGSLIIVNPKKFTQCREHEVGEIWLRSPSVAVGYWGQVEITSETFCAYTVDGDGPFLRTGDLGAIVNQQLFVTGRLKDLIIIRGRNFYPQDIEDTVRACNSVLSSGATAAFSVTFREEECLVILQEISRTHMRRFDSGSVFDSIIKAVSDEHGLRVHDIVLLKPASLPITTSGKLQRRLCRERFLQKYWSPLAQLSELAKLDIQSEDNNIIVDACLLVDKLRNHLATFLKCSPVRFSGELILSQIGLDSLLVIDWHDRIQKEFGIEFPLDWLFSEISLNQLSGNLAELCVQKNKSEFVDTSSKFTEVTEMAPNQRRLLYAAQMQTQKALYNIPVGVRIISIFDVAYFKQAVRIIIDRHSSLRTCFKGVGEATKRSILSSISCDTVFTEIDAIKMDEGELRIAAQRAANHQFDLGAGALIHLYIFSKAVNDNLIVFTVHHLAADLQSVLVLITELFTTYNSLTDDSKVELPPLNSTYDDFIFWQNSWFNSEKCEASKNYWLQQLSGRLQVLNLPYDRPRPATRSYSGATCFAHYAPELTSRIRGLATRFGTSLYVVLLSAYQLLLSRYTNQDDILVVSPINGRTQSEFDQVVGYFVNPVLMRSNLSGNPKFEDFLRRNKLTVVEALTHQHYPLTELIPHLDIQQSESVSSIYQTLFTLQTSTRGNMLSSFIAGNEIVERSLGKLRVRSYELSKDHTELDIAFAMVETENGLAVEITYNTDLFDMLTVRRLSEHFGVILRAVTYNPGQRVGSVPLLTDVEFQQIAKIWNHPPRDFPKDKCIHELFETQVEKTPDAIAVVFEGQQLSYSDLNTRANQLAHYLISEGRVKPDTLVGICVERSLEMVIGILAILKAGGAYVPLDPKYPKARLTYILDDAQLAMVVTEYHIHRANPISDAQALGGADNEMLKQHLHVKSTLNPNIHELGLTSRHLAYVIYTSGSTGNPKGVMVEHASVVNFLTSMRHKPGISSEDCVLAVTSTSFDIHGLELFLPLIVGAKLVVAPEAARQPEVILNLLKRHCVSLMQATPATWKMLLSGNWLFESPLKVLCGGEALSPHLAKSLLSIPRIELWNMYGPTETTIWSTTQQILPSADRILIGQPIANTQIFVTTKNMELVPVGIVGELLIGGAGLARGYLNHPDLTAEKFIPNPFYDNANPASSARLYKTGDLVRWLPDGNLEYLGRIDHQVKIRGFRIELSEIENTLGAQEAVKDVVVIAKEFADTDDKRLVAYVVTDVVNSAGSKEESESNISDVRDYIETLRKHLSQRLPDYMIPSAFVLLNKLPLTPNGKVDRTALPDPDLTATQATYVAPSTGTEKMLCEIWQDVLGVELVGITDNFFQLGGNSLLAARLVARINRAFGIALQLQILFSCKDLCELSVVISDTCAIQKNEQVINDNKYKDEIEW